MAIEAQLDTLEAKGLIRLATSRPDIEYLFRHWLVQDAAYGSLLRQERRELHRLVGEALEMLYPDRGSELAGILAIHFSEAGDKDKAVATLAVASKKLDKAVSKGVIHKNQAANKKSAIAKSVSAIK